MNPNAKRNIIILGLLVALGVVGWLSNRSATSEDGETCALPASPSPSSVEQTVTIESSGVPKFIDLGSTTCQPCKMMTPILDELSTEYKGRLSVEFINVAKDPKAGAKYQVRGIPTQIFFDKDGNEVFRHVGFFPKEEIIAKLKEMGIE